MVYVYYTDGDSINNNTANTSKKPDAILTLYVDDLMLAGGDKAVPKMLQEKLMSRFATTDMGDISMILSMQVTRNGEGGTLTISQVDYTRFVLEMYGMGKFKPVSTPGAGKMCHSASQKGIFLTNREAAILGNHSR